MTNPKLSIRVIAGVVLIVCCSLAASFLLVTGASLFGSCLLVILILYLTGNLIRYLNESNRKVSDFFESVRNNDFVLRYPDNTTDPYLARLYTEMNHLTSLISKHRTVLEQKTNYYETILYQLPIGILSVTGNNKVVFMNPAARRLLQCAPLNCIDQLEKVEPGLTNLFLSLPAGQHRLIKLSNERESRSLSLVATSIDLKSETIRLYTLQNIGKELDEKESESWIRLIRVMTHEIMNSITPLTSLSEDLLSHINQNTKEQVREGLEVIHEQGKSLISFINSYYRLTHLPAPQRADCPVKELFTKVSLLLGAEPGHERVRFTEPEDVSLFADRNLITLVMINLIKNAIQATDAVPVGEVTVSCGTSFVKVTDNGEGIRPELLDEIFVPFFTTRAGGNGIGLSVSRQIMRLHEGSLTVVSRPEEETCFTLQF